ncbi:23S rRNA (uracil(1939)-C(5))-methyltransferase RlmD [bacterium]|nr:23S rRNA (uracil(1939)-C(5))-methyltransferase RlmD [bacterium]
MGKELKNLKIEKISNTGTGIAYLDGKTVFIENVCPDDIVDAQIIKETKNYIKASVSEIVEKSKERIMPFCPVFNVCGACNFQYINYDYQLKLKTDMVKDAFKNNSEIEIRQTIPSPKNKIYRYKVQYPVTQTKNSKRILAGYFKEKSHEIVNIKYCPCQPDICNEITEFIRNEAKNYDISGYDEKTHCGLLRHIVLRVSRYNNDILLTLVVNVSEKTKQLSDFADKIREKFPEIKGVCLNYNTLKNNLIMTSNTETVSGQNYIEEELCGKIFKISSNTFFQINPYTAENIFSFIRNYICENYKTPSLFDAYAGIAAFGIVLSDVCSEVTSVEENEQSVKLAEEIIKENEINNIKLFAETMESFTEKNTNQKYDITIIDPPRKGCENSVLDSIMKLTKKTIIYVSCNPVTLARDIEYMKSLGAKVKFIQPFDMFCHTKHIESVAVIDLE